MTSQVPAAIGEHGLQPAAALNAALAANGRVKYMSHAEDPEQTPAERLARLDGIHRDAVVPLSSGAVALDPDAVKRLTAAGTPAIPLRRDTVTSDIEGMVLAVRISTGSGGRTPHAAVAARRLGKVCLLACPGLRIGGGPRGPTVVAGRETRAGTGEIIAGWRHADLPKEQRKASQ